MFFSIDCTDVNCKQVDQNVEFEVKQDNKGRYKAVNVRTSNIDQDLVGDIPAAGKVIRTKRQRRFAIPTDTPETDYIYQWSQINLRNNPGPLDILAKIALEEDWAYPGETKPVILMNYIRTTFYRLYKTGKLAEATISQGPWKGKWAAFNTGLVNKTYQPIYALFDESTRGNAPWRFVSWCISNQENTVELLGGEDLVKRVWSWWFKDDRPNANLPNNVKNAGKILSEAFNPLPDQAQYFEDANDVVMNPRERIDINYPHVIGDCILGGRFPLEFLKMYEPQGFVWASYLNAESEYVSYYRNAPSGGPKRDSSIEKMLNEYKECLDSDSLMQLRVQRHFEDAVSLAIQRSIWNYKTAIPIFWPRGDKISLLLPIALISPDTVDIALVVSATEGGSYRGQTTYRLKWAYTYARTVCRPDSDWLKTGIV